MKQKRGKKEYGKEDFVVLEWQKEIVRERIINVKPGIFKSYTEVQKDLKKKYGL